MCQAQMPVSGSLPIILPEINLPCPVHKLNAQSH
jgi:hypothetical protein